MNLFHLGGFVLGQDFGEVFIQPDLVRDPLGGRVVVASQHHAADVECLQGVDSLLGLGSNNVGQRHRPFQLSVHEDKHDEPRKSATSDRP